MAFLTASAPLGDTVIPLAYRWVAMCEDIVEVGIEFARKRDAHVTILGEPSFGGSARGPLTGAAHVAIGANQNMCRCGG